MSIGEELQSAVLKATKDWAKAERQTIRSERAGARARERMMRPYMRELTIKDITFGNMEKVYATVSGGGKFPAGARQVFYGMRPIVLNKLPDKDLESQYFTQTLLPQYLQEHPDQTASWDVVYDDRGHLSEPHTDRTIGIGTLSVRDYLAKCHNGHDAAEIEPPSINTDYETHGPANRFQNVLYIEKEGFLPLLQKAQIAERFDLAIMSSKGMGSTAARTLMEGLAGVRILVMHDFDKAGFSIVGTLQRDTRRFQFSRSIEIVDLGLRLADVQAEDLEGESVSLRGASPEFNLEDNGATKEEIAYLTGNGTGRGQRVELNAMTSPQFIAFLERKLKQHAVSKVVPGKAVLKDAYRRAYLAHRVNAEIDDIFDEINKEAEDLAVPKDLEKRVQARLKQHPEMPWDAVVSELAEQTTKE
jgi:hypothetical protein